MTTFVTPLTSTEESVNSNHIYLIPNPADDLFKVVVPTEWSEYHVSVLDLQGKEILKAKKVSGATEFNTSELSSGMYFVVVTAPSGRIFHQKLVLK